GTDAPPTDDSVFSVYLRAKAKADAHLKDSGLDWTVVRPGRLTDDPPTGRVRLARRVPRGEVTRADVAAVLLACLRNPATIGKVLELVGGDTPIEEAVAAVSR
ncbi:MAG TPA: NAD(P)H-binding protein, partial [Acidimicrobiia bacterium]|nr:NAD(P)H-binding protein [Acidimicrobiia bacterium]